MSLIRISRLGIDPAMIAFIIDGGSGFTYSLRAGVEAGASEVPQSVEPDGIAIHLVPTAGGVIRSRDPEEVEAVRDFIARLPDTPETPVSVEAVGAVTLADDSPAQGASVEKP